MAKELCTCTGKLPLGGLPINSVALKLDCPGVTLALDCTNLKLKNWLVFTRKAFSPKEMLSKTTLFYTTPLIGALRNRIDGLLVPGKVLTDRLITG